MEREKGVFLPLLGHCLENCLINLGLKVKTIFSFISTSLTGSTQKLRNTVLKGDSSKCLELLNHLMAAFDPE